MYLTVCTGFIQLLLIQSTKLNAYIYKNEILILTAAAPPTSSAIILVETFIDKAPFRVDISHSRFLFLLNFLDTSIILYIETSLSLSLSEMFHIWLYTPRKITAIDDGLTMSQHFIHIIPYYTCNIRTNRGWTCHCRSHSLCVHAWTAV